MVWETIAAGALGGIASGLFNRDSARDAEKTNVLAMQNRHQWEVADLEKAGLNPILAAHNGGTSGMPGVNPVGMPDLSSGMAGLANKDVERDNIQSLTNLNKKQINKVIQETFTEMSKQTLNHAQSDVMYETVNKVTMEIQKLSEEKLKLAYENQYKRIISEFYNENEMFAIGKELGVTPGKFLDILGGVLQKLTPSFNFLRGKPDNKKLKGYTETITTPKGRSVKQRTNTYE
jgi:hypothetical protein